MAKIAVDLDGVVYEFQRTWRYMLNEYRGYNLGPIEDWWHSWFDYDKGIAKEDMRWMWKEGVENGLFRYGHVTTGAIAGLRALLAEGHQLVVATHRPTNAVPDTLDWLSYLNIPWSAVHILSNMEPKSSIQADILVDDKTENVEEWADTGRLAILYHRPWNTAAIKHDEITRVNGWKEIPDRVRAISGEWWKVGDGHP